MACPVRMTLMRGEAPKEKRQRRSAKGEAPKEKHQGRMAKGEAPRENGQRI